MARPARPEQSKSARSSRQFNRFYHSINPDRVFGIHRDHIEEQHADDPRVLLEALLSGIAERFGRPAYRGCHFLNPMTEFPEQNTPGCTLYLGNYTDMN